MTARPVPVPDAQSAPWWEGAAGGRLVLASCADCGVLSHPPDLLCPACGSDAPRWDAREVDGRGAVRSWTVVRQAFLPGPEGDVPYVLVDVELDVQQDLRLVGRLLDGPEALLALGVRVRPAFEEIAPGTSVPAFVLDAADGERRR